MSSFDLSLGASLLTKDGSNKPTGSLLSGKRYIGLYFSAHWCPPCRNFTPMLSTFYSQLKDKSPDQLEIVFISSDKGESEFTSYYSEMPWLALPFSERGLKANLSSDHGVEGIPTLVIIDGETGEVITNKGTSKVRSDPTGTNFPWRPLSLAEEIGQSFQTSNGETITASFTGKYIGLYFSASWCGPCQNFTPKLASLYTERKSSGVEDFEVIYCSGDRSKDSFSTYVSKMPWISLPFQDPRVESLSERFDIEGYPTLIIIDPEGNVITKDAVSAVSADPKGSKFPFYPEPIVDISVGLESYGYDINRKPSLIFFGEPLDDGEQSDIKAALLPLAIQYAKSKATDPKGPDMLFFFSSAPSGMSERIRELTKLGATKAATKPSLIILDIPKDGAYYLSPALEEYTGDSLRNFVESFFAGSLERLQLEK